MRTWAALALACLLLSGCSQDAPDVDDDSATIPGTDVPLAGNATDNATVAPPPLARFNESYDLVVTYASVTEGGGSNFAQPNCVGVNEANILNGTATVTWSPDATSAQLELVARSFGSAAGEQRKTGGPPLSVQFAFDDTGDQVIVSVQSPATGAVQQLPVTLTIAFDHPASDAPVAEPRLCAF